MMHFICLVSLMKRKNDSLPNLCKVGLWSNIFIIRMQIKMKKNVKLVKRENLKIIRNSIHPQPPIWKKTYFKI